MNIPIKCIGCVHFIPAHIGGADPGEYIKAECAIHARFPEDCKEQEYGKQNEQKNFFKNFCK